MLATSLTIFFSNLEQSFMPVLTKTQQVENYVRNRIQRGIWSPGQRLPEPDKISSKLGVSAMTVKNTLARLASEGIVERKQKLGTFVAEADQTGTIVILAKEDSLVSLAGHYYRSLLKEARSYLQGRGYKVVLVLGHGEAPEEFYNSIHLTEKPFCNRVIGVLSLVELGELQQRIDDAGMHSVSIIPGGLTETKDHYSIMTDYAEMMRIATEELHRRGYDDFALMCGGGSGHEDPVIGKAFSRLIRGAVEFDDSRIIHVPYCWDWQNAGEVFREWWTNGQRKKAVVFFDDALCDVASRVFGELGIRIPEDLAIITHANTNTYFHTSTKLTRVEFDSREIITAACQMLDDIIEGKEVADRHKYARPKLVAGDSL